MTIKNINTETAWALARAARVREARWAAQVAAWRAETAWAAEATERAAARKTVAEAKMSSTRVVAENTERGT